jgi:predicted RNase H-like nuclease
MAQWLAGADGCRTGWVAAFWHPRSGELRIRILPRFADFACVPEKPDVIAVDMPIGLPGHIGPEGRGPERMVRPLLGMRQSSVFSVPSRAAVYAPDFRKACQVAMATSDPPRQLSKQLFMIAPKIREVDGALRADPQLAARTFEVHPEVAFWRLNGDRALTEPKKVKGTPYPPGLTLRRRLLFAAGFAKTLLKAAPPRGAAPDDVLDALACAAIARRIDAGLARPFPDPPGRDEHGLPIAIWA